ncbi:plasmid segregation centromere-binding protein ParR [Dolichospermum circinale]|uniref:plasmid segregation centromere-binding protein ParR n=1 Tax=Dolichospermum circinale TaxID=109265 RepID=UPI002330554A|nr:plasmid segregation centromere-binding protein ParR [Dolichospermum circinale]MDB9453082.1 plasmid segregation centromere-binding protein ParR [Dolichospermum circinale CS-541/06]MDB9464738.1 plasmid segregation centromere-binding protein ParR [Dolichospermum circinale CS-541/04]MDB9546145.1 plasmid segregation centromere-binding protein ParR [Dolichospermum circinale CS-1031]
MFQWSKKVVKSVTFNPEIADESLLAQVENYLETQQEKTFSDLCKEALWKVFLPEPVQPVSKTADITTIEQKISEMQVQIATFEERFFAQESRSLEAIESQMLQLTQQVAKLTTMLGQQPPTYIPSPPDPEPEPEPQEVDPVISRIGQFLDDF